MLKVDKIAAGYFVCGDSVHTSCRCGGSFGYWMCRSFFAATSALAMRCALVVTESSSTRRWLQPSWDLRFRSSFDLSAQNGLNSSCAFLTTLFVAARRDPEICAIPPAPLFSRCVTRFDAQVASKSGLKISASRSISAS